MKVRSVHCWGMVFVAMCFSYTSATAQVRVQSPGGKKHKESSAEPLEIVIKESPATATPAPSNGPAAGDHRNKALVPVAPDKHARNSASAEEAMDAQIRRAEERVRNLQGTEALLGRLNVVGLKRLRKPMIAFNAAQAAMNGSEAFDFGRIRTLDDLEHRIRAFEQLQRSSADLKRALQTLPSLFAEEMRNSGGNEELIPEAVQVAVSAIGLNSMLAEQEAVDQMSSSAIAQLRVLKRNWGKWDGQGPQVRFEPAVSSGDIRAFREYGEEVQASLVRIGQLRQSSGTE